MERFSQVLCGVFYCLAGNCHLFDVNGFVSFAPFPSVAIV